MFLVDGERPALQRAESSIRRAGALTHRILYSARALARWSSLVIFAPTVHIVTIKHNKFPSTELKYIMLYDGTKDSLTPGHIKSLHKFGVHSACSAQGTPTLL